MEGTPQATADEHPVPKERKHQIRLVQSNGDVPQNGDFSREGEDISTTTLSTIAVRAGDHASIVVALLKSVGYIQLRIDEMKPGLLAIGGSSEEAAALLHIHEDLMARLKDKEDQVTALLTRAEGLSSEKEAKEAVVYDDMAKCLREAWQGLNKQLLLRGYLLKETLNFYQLAQHHEQLVNTVTEALKRIMAGENGGDTSLAAKKIEQNVNDLIETTAQAVDAGSSVIAQIRTLGQLSDNPERAQETLAACVLIEKVMLRIASEWERVETTWKTEKSKVVVTETVDELYIIEEWLTHAERRVKAVNEIGFKRLLDEGNTHKSRLVELGASGAADGARITHLNGRIEEFLHYVKTRMNRSQRIQAFFQSAQTMLSQLSMMEADMRNANAAMADELYPLAQQKATAVIHEGRDIAAKEVLTYEEHALVKQRCQEMEYQLHLLEELANERQRGTQVSQELASLQSWHTMRVVPFLATHADMGGTLNEAVDFLEAHKLFVDEVVNRDASVMSATAKRSEMSVVEQTAMREFELNYEKLKDVLEHRIRIGNNFVQVHKFAKDLESSFDALTSLLDTNRDFTNERVAGQVDNVFHMIEETMTQEKHDVERFVNAAEAVAKGDETLDVSRSVQAAKNMIIDHDHRFTYVKHKWDEWQRNKAELKKKVTIIEEIEMWQEDTWEIIKLLENTTVTTLQESEGLHRRVKELGQTIDQQTSKLEEAKKYTENEEYNRRVEELMRKQEEIKDRYKKLEKKVETIYESFAQQEIEERIRAPQILTSLKDAQVDEGSRFEFVARIEGEPEPKISWLKDGIDVKNNIDYRQDYINGVASLVIEETFIEDTATYTVRAANAGGVAESSAKLTVKSRSAVSSLLEEEKPRFMKQLTNVQVTEGQTAHLDCVVIGRPEPEVVWFKEEKTVQEDERIHLDFAGDHCSLTIERTVPPDTGMYTAKARNIHGESTNFCQLKVIPKKQPPPTPPKPAARPLKAPSIQTSLATSTYEEGDTAILQIYAQGEPKPSVEWRFNEQPIYTTETVKTEEKEDGWHRLIISPVTPAHTGVYTAVAVNEAGESRTSATLHVQPSTTARTSMHEDMLQEDVYERIGRPTERTEEVIRRESMQYSETTPIPAPREETTKTSTEKRWVELVEEQMSQPSPIPEPIPVPTETKKKVTEQRWVDQIDEVFEQASQKSAEQREVQTAETYVKMVDELMRDTLPKAMREATHTVTTKEYAQQIHEAPRPEVQTTTTTQVSTEAYHAGQIHKAPQPEVQTTTTTQRTEAYHAGQIREAPLPQVEKTTTTHVSTEAFHAGQIREAPQPKVETTTTTQVTTEAYHAGQICEAPQPKVETTTTTHVTTEAYHAGAYYEASPQPEVQRTTTTEKTEKMYHAKYPETPRPPEVEMATLTSEVVEREHAATIRKTPVPESHKGTISEALSVENVAAIRRSPAPESHRATLTHGASLENIAAIRRSPAPEVHKARISRGASVENIGKIRQSPAPEIHKASVSHGSNLENVAAIRRTPAPDTHQATITSAVSVENIAAIGRTPIPESHHAEVTSTALENAATIRRTPAPETGIATTTTGSAVENIGAIRRTPAPETGIATTTTGSAVENIGAIRRTPAPETGIATTTTGSAVENIGAIRQSEPVHPHTATQTPGTMKENVAQIHQPTPQPDKQQFTKSAVPIDRIDDIIVPERVPHTTAEVTQTVTDEGFIRHLDQDFTPTQVTTTERTVHGGVAVERGGKVIKEGEEVVTVTEKTEREDAEQKRQLEQLEKMEKEVEERLRRGPEVEKRVTQTTSAEGWVQHVEDDMTKPQAVQTTKRYEKEVVEDSLSKKQTTAGGETTVSTTKKEEEEEQERKRLTQSRIPQRTTKVTTTTTADGFVQHVHDEMTQPVEVTSTTRTEGEDAQWKRTVQTRRAEPVTEKTTATTTTSYVQMSASRPFEPTTQTKRTTEEREEHVVEDQAHRDSFIAASEGEGFWTDGAYTTSPSPPPIPRHRVLEEELREQKISEFGLSRTSSEPQFIRAFHREYTVDEGGSISIESVLVGNPRPKVRFFFNEKEIRKESKFVEIVTSGDTYSIVIDKARLEHAGYYKIIAENTRGKTESLTMLHVRPQSLIQHKRNGYTAPSQKITEYRTPTEHTTVTEEFAMFEYEQRRPQKHETSRLVTPPPAKRFQAHRKDEEMLEHYDMEQQRTAGHPPHFTQTLVAAVAADGETAKFEGIVTGWPAPTVEWTKDGAPFTRTSLPDVDISNIGGRVSLTFKNCRTIHGGKYMCTARNASGVATSSAQLVIRPKTVAPDFIQRLISEEMVEGDQLKWTVRVTGDPLPRVTWLRDGIEIPDCEEVRIIDEGDGVHSLLIVRVEIADSGQFTCLAENVAGEARSTADLVVRQPGSRPGSYFHITKVTQEKQIQGEHPVRNSAFTIENPPLQSAML